MTSKPEDIRSKLPFKKIKKCEGVINYKIIREIHRKIQANTSNIRSELGGGQHGLLRLEMQPATYQKMESVMIFSAQTAPQKGGSSLN